MHAAHLTLGDLTAGVAAGVVAGGICFAMLTGSAAPAPDEAPREVVVSIARAAPGSTSSAGRASTAEAQPDPALVPDSTDPPTPRRARGSRNPRRGADAQPSVEESAEGPASSGVGEGPAPSGVGEGPASSGVGEGTADAETVAAYRAELLGWLSGRFMVERSGLDADVLSELRVRASVSIDDAGTVKGFTVTGPSGFSVVDDAVRHALEPLVGRAIPTPPPGYPGTIPPKLSVTFVCSARRCS